MSHQARDVFNLWNVWEDECGHECGIPYWAVVWPGAAVLADFILRNTDLFCNKTVLELGCGGAVAVIAAAQAGAGHVIANDIDPVALHVAQFNAKANNVSIEINGNDLTASDFPAKIDVILVADMFYQREQSQLMMEFLARARNKGTCVFIADGHRPFAPKTGIEVLVQEWIPVNLELEGVSEREVRLLVMN